MNIARWMIGFVGLAGMGGLLVDFVLWETARQHMKNPKWPPHAKFHNAQGILLGLGLGALTLILVCGPRGSSRSGLLEAAGAASLYWLSMLFASLFPGTAWSDPEFRSRTRLIMGLPPQHVLAMFLIALLGAALAIGLRT